MKNGHSTDIDQMRKKHSKAIIQNRPWVSVGMGTCGIGNGAQELFDALAAQGARVRRVGCFGFCAAEPVAMLYYPGKPLLLFQELTAKDAPRLAKALGSEADFDKAARKATAKIEAWDFHTARIEFGSAYPALKHWNELDFFRGQQKVVLRDSGLIDPESIEEYISVGGYSALARALGSTPEKVIAEVSLSGLRGRGGAGYPAARKWEMMRRAEAEQKFVICNADEGDPGAYMNRNEVESDPHALVEGMIIGGYAMGATSGFIYMRAEYPLAVERLRKAIDSALATGLLGKNILGTGFDFDLEIVKGAGAFVCGEETALIASAEGKAGRPLPRPPFPAQSGYLGAPTNINNVETWCNIPLIINRGGEWFSKIGIPSSTGTKVFSLVGKVRNTGLVELPLGTSLEAMVYGMGGGAGANKSILALQSGGPSGGCIPAKLFGTKIDYESLAALGAIMGSGGMVALDRDNCMVDVARYFIGFTASESCGKCVSCREGLSQMQRILERICRGVASMDELSELERLALFVRDSSLCGLGQTASNPVLTTLKYFREDYERHIRNKRCDSGSCESLFLALCENSCPLHMNIPGYLALMNEGRIEQAFELTLRDNPLPGTLGRICHFHCQMRCRREQIDETFHQGEIHRYLADSIYKMGREKAVWATLVKEKFKPSGKRVAIIGAGPAGLSAAFYLSRLGHEVTVYDAHNKAGGILRYGIPAYRLPKEVLDKELELWKRLGVNFVFNKRVGKDLSLKDVRKDCDALLICVGAEGDKTLGLPGENLPGVHSGYAWLDAFGAGTAPALGKRVLVIGGGNVAIDAARTLIRLGREVTVVYRRTLEDMPANALELKGAKEEGVHFMPMLGPKEILDNGKGRAGSLRCAVMRPGAIDSSGRPRPEASGELLDIPCDDIIVAVGERVESADLLGGKKTPDAKALDVSCTPDGRIEVDSFTLRSGSKGIWACGDAVTGPATAAEAMGLAKQAAREIDRYLTGMERFHQLFKDFDYSKEGPAAAAPSKRIQGKYLPPSERIGNFIEVSCGYSADQASAEASRCLRCDLRRNARSPWR